MTVLRQLRHLQPDLRLRLDVVPDPLTHATAADIAFHFGNAAPDGPFRTRLLFRIPERLVASPAYLESRGHPRSVRDLEEHDLLRWQPPGEDAHRLPLLGGRTMTVAPRFVSPYIHLVRSLALAGQGFALVPEGAAIISQLPGDLVPVLPDQVGRDCTLWLLVPEPLAASSRLRAALDLLDTLAEG